MYDFEIDDFDFMLLSLIGKRIIMLSDQIDDVVIVAVSVTFIVGEIVKWNYSWRRESVDAN